MPDSPAADERELRERLARLLAQRRDYRQLLEELTSKFRHVVFFGVGNIFHGIVQAWEQHLQRKIDFCCDSDRTKWGKAFSGVTCISPEDLEEIKGDSAVFVTVGNFKPLRRTLIARGFPSVNIVHRYDLAAARFLAGQDNEALIAKLCEAQRLLSDAHSSDVFLAIVDRVLGRLDDGEIMARVCVGDEYFPRDIIRLSDHESFVDAGAYDGDTIRDFLARTQARFERVFAFEVDDRNARILRDQVSRLPEHRKIEVYNLGVWDSAGDIAYSSASSQSMVGGGEDRGQVVRLDDVLKDENVSLIKMDIEGAELRALRGASSIIRRQKPRLAICVYHDFRHLWEVPLFIRELVPEYRVYLRHHSDLSYETVCYAVP